MKNYELIEHIAPDCLDVEFMRQGIGIPFVEWPGNCHAIAYAMNHISRIGTTRYGHYHGFIHPTSMFAGHGVVRHGWIELACGRVYDPTRWVFESLPPYIFVGSAEGYDAGGQYLRTITRRPIPPGDGEHQLDFQDWQTELFFATLVGKINTRTLTIDQLFYIANLPISEWGNNRAADLVAAYDAIGKGAFIPFDNRNLVLGLDSMGDDSNNDQSRIIK